MRFFFLALATILPFVADVCHATDIDLKRRIVQTLIDSEQGRDSSGDITVTAAESSDYSVQTGVKWESFAITHRPHEDPPGGVFKITAGPYRYLDLKARWWKKLPVQDREFRDAEVWTRPLTARSNRYTELLVRQQFRENITLELRLTFETSTGAVDTLLARYRQFANNAKRNGVLGGVAARAASSKSSSTATATGNDYSGTWSGPMRNSKGSKASQSSLILKVHPNNRVTGAWFSGWKITDGKRNGNVITWTHKGMMKGCRDYSNKMVVEPGGKLALLTYDVTDRCSKPANYTGTHRLTKK